MAVDQAAWFIGGGAVHGPEVARLVAYVATAGAEGITAPNSLRVTPEAVPAATVRVLTGAAVIVNRYPGGGQQSYMIRNPSTTSVAIEPTGSGGGRTDLVIARVLDPQYEGAPPEDPTKFDYTRLTVIPGVSAGIKSARELDLAYPAIALAKVSMPKSRADVQPEFITDLREVANPRRAEVLRARASVVADTETLAAEGVDGEWFPNLGGEQEIDIPEWATRMIVEADWIQLNEPGGNSWGDVWVEYGPYVRPSTRKYATQRYGWNTHAGADSARSTYTVADDKFIDPSIRGTTQPFIMKGRVRGKSDNAARPQLTGYSGVKLRITFLEVADKSTS